jgi:hypothetical protein
MSKRDRECDNESDASEAEDGASPKMSKKEAEETKAEAIAAVVKRVEEAEKRNHVPVIIAHFAIMEGGSSVCYIRKDGVPQKTWDILVSWFCDPESAYQVVNEPMPLMKNGKTEKEPMTDAEKEKQAVRWWYDCIFNVVCEDDNGGNCSDKEHHRHSAMDPRNCEMDQGQGASAFLKDEEIVLHFTGTTYN